MRSTVYVVLMVGSMLFSDCTAPEQKPRQSSRDSSQAVFEKNEADRLARRSQMEEFFRQDSIDMSLALSSALDTAKRKVLKEGDTVQYQFVMDSMYADVQIGSRNYFKGPSPYLLIRASGPGNVYIDLYARSGDDWVRMLSHKQWSLEYVNDTIMDVNGDERKDFVVNWYGTTGCCLKGFSIVYLLREDMKSFSSGFEFINPTFSPKEQVVRGVEYGHPGETSMYKYKWVGERVDTLEYVNYETDTAGRKTGKVELSNARGDVLSVLPSVPREYRKIYGYDWFTGKF